MTPPKQKPDDNRRLALQLACQDMRDRSRCHDVKLDENETVRRAEVYLAFLDGKCAALPE